MGSCCCCAPLAHPVPITGSPDPETGPRQDLRRVKDALNGLVMCTYILRFPDAAAAVATAASEAQCVSVATPVA